MNHGSCFAGIGGFDLGFERAGILRRAEKRNKTLPAPLEAMLKAVAGVT